MITNPSISIDNSNIDDCINNNIDVYINNGNEVDKHITTEIPQLTNEINPGNIIINSSSPLKRSSICNTTDTFKKSKTKDDSLTKSKLNSSKNKEFTF